MIATAQAVAANRAALPQGARVVPIPGHDDSRGAFTEVFRAEWDLGPQPVQWNMVRSNGNVMRGVHVHRRHWDYLTVVQGEMIFGLRDLRVSSATFGRSLTFRLVPDDPHLVVVPAGVAHGFYFPTPSVHFYSVSEYFNSQDELGCHWADPELGLDWPGTAPELSERDKKAGSLAELLAELARA